MPLYDYDCAACGRRLEVVHGVHAPGPTSCAACGGGPLTKAIAAPAVHFRGSGWAKRDRRATPTPGVSRSSSDSTPAAEGEAKGGVGTSDRSKSDGGGDVASERAAEPSTTTAAGTATKTD